MADPKIIIRRSSTPNKVPTESQLSLGELAINTYDGKLYLERDQSSAGLGVTVIAVNPWNVGVGSTAYDTYFTAGNIGVGVTNPTKLLDVNGDIRISGGIYDSNNDVGIAGSVLSSTGSGWEWISPSSGAQGSQGSTGAQGDTGSTGAQGSQGTAGAQGDTGSTGAQGAQGSIGAQGSQGSAGAQGDTGSTGAQGAQGDIGAQGSVGAQGSQGTTGAQGDTGSTGAQGAQGDIGAQGDTGSTGAQGDTGSTGAQGAQGTSGTSVTIVGSVDDVNVDPPGDPQITLDNAFPSAISGNAAIDTATGELWVYDGTDWINVGQIVGPQGAQGAQGSTGAQGDIGVQGSQGTAGAQGDTGSTGSQGATGSTGAQGSQGTAGAQGATGSTGAQGSQGPAGSGSGSIVISETAPVSPNTGDLWYDSNVGRIFIYYNDVDSSQWVDASPAGGGSTNSNAGGLFRTKYDYIATSNQTSFVASGIQTGYVDVFVNGILLETSNYNITPTGIDLNSGAYVNDEVTIFQYRSDVETYASISGIATYASTAGIATYAEVAGISTNVIGGIGSITQLNVSGISTFNSNVQIDGRLRLNYLQYEDDSAVTDFFYVAPDNHIVTAASDWTLKLKARASGANEGNLWLEAGQNTKIKVKGNGSNIDLIASDGSTSATWNLNKNGQLTFPNNTVQTTAFVGYANTAGIATYASTSGVSTYADNAGIATYASTAGISTYAASAGVSTSVIGGVGSVTQLNVSGIATASSYNTTYDSHGSVIATTSSTSQVGIHSDLSATIYRSVEYMVQATEGTNFHTTKILTIHNGTSAYLTEYGTIYNNSTLASYDVDISGGNIRLLATPASSSSTTFKISFTSIIV